MSPRFLKQELEHAVVTTESQVRTPENAEAMLRARQADLVSIVRGLIADPFWARKVHEDRADDVRGCISCNQMCWGRRSRDYWISCLVNPSVGREHEWGSEDLDPAPAAKTILVIGAGPAGLETARVAAERGHRVILCEASDRIGGQFRLAGEQPRRGQLIELLDWYERQFDRLGVDLRLNAFVDGAAVADFDTDEVVVATGSLPAETGHQRWLPERETLDGLEKGGVCSSEEIMQRSVTPGKRVVLVDEGGHWKGAGTAWHLAERGHELTIVTPDTHVGAELHRTTSDFQLRRVLARSGAAFHTESVIESWNGGGASIRSLLTGEITEVAADNLVLATTNVAFDKVGLELDELSIAHHENRRLRGATSCPLCILRGTEAWAFAMKASCRDSALPLFWNHVASSTLDSFGNNSTAVDETRQHIPKLVARYSVSESVVDFSNAGSGVLRDVAFDQCHVVILVNYSQCGRTFV